MHTLFGHIYTLVVSDQLYLSILSDCPALNVSPETIKSSDSTYFDETVKLDCPTGYKFHLEKYSENRSLTLTCSGEWYIGNDALVAIPECRSKYILYNEWAVP